MSMSAALNTYLEGALASVHTSLPATVVSYDESKHRAKVKPSVRMLMENGVKIELPDLLDVPVIFPSAKSFDLEFPLDKGDGVLLLVQELDISEWKADEKIPTASTASRFNLDAVVAIPGMFPKRQGGKARIYVDKNGVLTWEARKIVFKGQMVFEDDVIARKDVYVGVGAGPGVSVSQHIHPTAAGPTSPPTPATPIPPEEV